MDGYSRLVSWLKVLLPMIALGLLSTLFLLSRNIDPVAQIPFAETELRDRLRSEQITGPFYTGVTRGGDQMALTAERLVTDGADENTNLAENLTGQFDLLSGTRVNLWAREGRFDIRNARSELTGDVKIETSTGFTLRSQNLIASLDVLDVHSPGPVQSDGPFGTLDAGSMSMTAPAPGEPTQLIFKNGVKLIYEPRNSDE